MSTGCKFCCEGNKIGTYTCCYYCELKHTCDETCDYLEELESCPHKTITNLNRRIMQEVVK